MRYTSAITTALCISILMLTVSCKKTDKDFSIPDVSGITSVMLQQDTLATTLTQADGSWQTNDSIDVGEEQLYLLFNLLNMQQAVYAIGEDKQAEAADLLAKHGVNVKAYEAKKLVLDFTVYYTEELGYFGRTYSNQQVYLLSIPNSEDDPLSYLSANPAFWRHNVIITSLPSEITMVEIDDLINPEYSYRITRNDKRQPTLYDLFNETTVENASIQKLNTYLSYFSGLSYKEILDLSEEDHQSILLSDSPYKITIETENEGRIVLQIYYIEDEELDAYGNVLDYDPDNFYLGMNDSRDIALARWIDFDLLLRDFSDFVEN